MLAFTGANLAGHLVICQRKEVPEDNQRRTAVSSTQGCSEEKLWRAVQRCSTQRGCRTFLPASEVALPPDLSISDSCSNTSLRTHKRRTCQSVLKPASGQINFLTHRQSWLVDDRKKDDCPNSFYWSKCMHIGYNFGIKNAVVKQLESYHIGTWEPVVWEYCGVCRWQFYFIFIEFF